MAVAAHLNPGSGRGGVMLAAVVVPRPGSAVFSTWRWCDLAHTVIAVADHQKTVERVRVNPERVAMLVVTYLNLGRGGCGSGLEFRVCEVGRQWRWWGA